VGSSRSGTSFAVWDGAVQTTTSAHSTASRRCSERFCVTVPTSFERPPSWDVAGVAHFKRQKSTSAVHHSTLFSSSPRAYAPRATCESNDHQKNFADRVCLAADRCWVRGSRRFERCLDRHHY